MSQNNEGPCGEFDWFATDSVGAFALFSRFESGFIPRTVLDSFKEHEELSNIIDLPNWGSESVWSGFASKGLFVYDWKPNNGPYVLKKEAPDIRDEKFIVRLAELSSLPEYSGKFAETKSMASLDNWHRV